MDTIEINKLINRNNLLNISTESFMCEGALYNASYIPTDDFAATIMLEKVINYPNENIYYKNKINIYTIKVLNSAEIKISSFIQGSLDECYDIALAAATAAYKFDLVKNYLTVDTGERTISFHINSSNR